MFLTKTDLTNIIYQEDMDAITEGDDTKVDAAMNAAVAEAQSYLDRYDVATLFGTTGTDRDPILLECCISIACAYLIRLCPANQSVKEVKENAADARAWLTRVQSARATPVGWPLKADPTLNTFFHTSSLPKRINHF